MISISLLAALLIATMTLAPHASSAGLRGRRRLDLRRRDFAHRIVDGSFSAHRHFHNPRVNENPDEPSQQQQQDGGGEGELAMMTCDAVTSCPEGYYCRSAGDVCPPSSGETGGVEGQGPPPPIAGTCEETSARCTREYRPKCGCDGVTYGNACTARYGQRNNGGLIGFSEGPCQ